MQPTSCFTALSASHNAVCRGTWADCGKVDHCDEHAGCRGRRMCKRRKIQRERGKQNRMRKEEKCDKNRGPHYTCVYTRSCACTILPLTMGAMVTGIGGRHSGLPIVFDMGQLADFHESSVSWQAAPLGQEEHVMVDEPAALAQQALAPHRSSRSDRRRVGEVLERADLRQGCGSLAADLWGTERMAKLRASPPPLTSSRMRRDPAPLPRPSRTNERKRRQRWAAPKARTHTENGKGHEQREDNT